MTHDKEDKTAALLIIGNEILTGRTQDKNTSWLGAQLMDLGIPLIEVRVVPDIEAEIIGAVHALRVKADYVFTTGGIGPTHDDITAESVAKAFDTELELNAQAYDILVDHYGSEQDVTPPRKKMAMIPKGARLIYNPVSGAPGFQIENVFVMAGVPSIMQGMFDDIRARLTPGAPILTRSIACKLKESEISDALGEIQAKYAPDIEIGSYPHFRDGDVGVNIVLRGRDEIQLDKCRNDVEKAIQALGG